jgi:multiple sugar transport system permease protein
VPVGMALGLAIALLLNLKIRGMAVWRTFFYLPAIVPMVAASVLWIQILNPQIGLLNHALEPVFGFFGSKPPGWLMDPLWSKPAIIVMGLWGAGGGMIIWLAGLKSIDNALYEAADVDGANEWQKLWHITLPQLTPYIFFNLVMGLIGTFQVFGQAFIMTQGGPKDSTLFYVYHLFNNAFRYGHMGYASAMAWILFLIVLAFTVMQLKLSKRWVHYEHE